MYNIVEINNIFDKYVSYNMNRNTWVLITSDLLNYINVTINDINIVKRKINSSFPNNQLYKIPKNTPIEYTNYNYTNTYLSNIVKITIDDINIKTILKNWSNNQLYLSNYENKLYFIFYILYKDLTQLKDKRTYRLIKEWLNYLYYIKRKSLRNHVNNTLWGVYKEIIKINDIISVNNNILYINTIDWDDNIEENINILNSITPTFNKYINDIMVLSDNKVVDIYDNKKGS